MLGGSVGVVGMLPGFFVLQFGLPVALCLLWCARRRVGDPFLPRAGKRGGVCVCVCVCVREREGEREREREGVSV